MFGYWDGSRFGGTAFLGDDGDAVKGVFEGELALLDGGGFVLLLGCRGIVGGRRGLLLGGGRGRGGGLSRRLVIVAILC